MFFLCCSSDAKSEKLKADDLSGEKKIKHESFGIDCREREREDKYDYLLYVHIFN